MSSSSGRLAALARRLTIDVDRGYAARLPAIRRGVVERHGLATRLLHWTLFVLVTSMAVTGFIMWLGPTGALHDPILGGYLGAFGVPLGGALFVLPAGIILFPVYHVVVADYLPASRRTELREVLIAGYAVGVLVVLFALWGAVYRLLTDPVWGGYYTVFGIHMWAAVLVLPVGFVLFPFYHVVVDRHDPVPTLQDVRELLAIGAALLGLRRYIAQYHEARRSWDETDREWLAYHPMQKLFFWIQLGLLAGVVLTGYGMYDYITTTPVPWWIDTLAIGGQYLTYEGLKQAHYFLTFAWVGAIAFHAYFPLIPNNWDVLLSMFSGRLSAHLIEGEADPPANEEK